MGSNPAAPTNRLSAAYFWVIPGTRIGVFCFFLEKKLWCPVPFGACAASWSGPSVFGTTGAACHIGGMRDVVIVGGGHNGLVCGYYLARAGLRVTIAERRGVVGGAAVTETFHPGFRNSVASYTVSLLHERVIADMRLHARGLRIVERPISNFLPTEDGGYLKLGGGLERTQDEVAKFSARDAARLPDYYAMLEGVADVLRVLATQTPPNLPDGVWGLGRALQQGNLLRRLDVKRQRDLLDLFTKSARQLLDFWFESDPIKAALGFDSIVGNYASPDTPGSAYVLLHHNFGGVNGRRGNWGHAIGGMGAITQAMAQACEEAGVTIRLDCAVQEVLVSGGTVTGVKLADGSTLAASLVVSNLNPKLLFTRLMDPDTLPADFLARMTNYKCGSGTFRMNVALSELPDFTVPAWQRACGAPRERHRAGAHAGLHGPRLPGRAAAWLVTRADRGDAYSEHGGCHPGATWQACGEPVLPAGGAAITRARLGECARRGSGPDDRYREPVCAEFCGFRDCQKQSVAERSGGGFRVGWWRHHAWAYVAGPALVGAACAGERELPGAGTRVVYVWGGNASRWRCFGVAGDECGSGGFAGSVGFRWGRRK